LNPEKEPRGLDLRFSVRVRGNAGTFSIYRSGPTYEVSWHEAGQHYAVFGNRVWPSELLKIAAGLRRIF
jgi:hypothetical protein